MDISAKRLNKLTKFATQSAMATLEAGLPEFNMVALRDLREAVEMSLSDIIESHVHGLTQDEYVANKEPAPF